MSGQTGLVDYFESVADIVVAKDGSGDYVTIMEAVAAVPDNSSERTVMFIRNGTYYEKMLVPSTKRNLVMVGEHVDSVILTYSDYADLVGGTFNTASFRVDADNFWAMNLTFENTAGNVGQALALYTDGDKQVFLHCRLLGWQDTFYSGSPYRNYFKDCFIEGAVDYIFGETVVLFDSCQIQIVRTGAYVTAASTNENYAFGYVFRNCNVTGAPGITGSTLGRPWKPYARTVFMNSYLHKVIQPTGWTTWGGRENTCYYAEYNNSGPGYVPDQRVNWSHILTDQEAEAYTMENIFSKNTGSYITDDWMPDADSDSLYRVIKAHTLFFMDSANCNTNLLRVEYEGEGTLNFDPGRTSYGIELPPGTTVVPLLNVVAEDPRATVEIEYPESLPGVTYITVTAYDQSTYRQYDIYNSIDGAYHNAWLDSLYIKNKRVEDFQPDRFEYDFELPAGSSIYFAVDAYKQAPDSKVKITKPATLPGTMVITVTSYSGEYVNEYVVNLTLATGLAETEFPAATEARYENGQLICRIHLPADERITVEIYDLKGNMVAKRYALLPAGFNTTKLPLHLPDGYYLYRAATKQGQSSGRFSVMEENRL
ncbi:MAG: hypothetical protein JXR52_12705 [Bacteroidales bacterium]|nr:hypothetical protein [Bacteroidales bacterium]